MGKEERNDDVPGGELAGAFLVVIEEEIEKGGEEGVLDGGQSS